MSDLSDPANATLTSEDSTDQPIAPTGDQTGPEPALAHPVSQKADGTPVPAEVPTGQPDQPVPDSNAPPWLRPTDGALLTTESQALNVCKSCGSAIPIHEPSCTRCGRFAPKNSPRKPRKRDVDKEYAALVKDFRPQNAALKAFTFQLARALVESRAHPLGSAEWQRAMTTAQQLAAMLDGARPTLPTDADFDAMSLDVLEARAARVHAQTKALRDEDHVASSVTPDHPVDDRVFAAPEITNETATPEPAQPPIVAHHVVSFATNRAPRAKRSEKRGSTSGVRRTMPTRKKSSADDEKQPLK
jgi:hypothetical protein